MQFNVELANNAHDNDINNDNDIPATLPLMIIMLIIMIIILIRIKNKTAVHWALPNISAHKRLTYSAIPPTGNHRFSVLHSHHISPSLTLFLSLEFMAISTQTLLTPPQPQQRTFSHRNLRFSGHNSCHFPWISIIRVLFQSLLCTHSLSLSHSPFLLLSYIPPLQSTIRWNDVTFHRFSISMRVVGGGVVWCCVVGRREGEEKGR